MAIKCPKGHWYEPSASQPAGRCPICAIETREGATVSDDDVLAILSDPVESHPETTATTESNKALGGSAIMRRKKVCPDCSHEASFSFVYCPRCGAPLKTATIEIR